MRVRPSPTKLAFVAAAVLAVLSLADARGFRRYWRLRQNVESLSEQNQLTAARNRAMMLEVQALRGDLRALETAAREELGFVRAGEIVIHLE